MYIILESKNWHDIHFEDFPKTISIMQKVSFNDGVGRIQFDKEDLLKVIATLTKFIESGK